MADKLKVNRSKVRAMLKDPALEKHLLGIAQRIAERAGEGHVASSMIGKNRARASVITATPIAMAREAKRGNLWRAAAQEVVGG